MDPLLQRARDGDEMACNELVASFSDRLDRWVRGRIGQHLARYCRPSDVRQEVFQRVMPSLDSLPPDATLRTFWGRLQRHAQWVIADLGGKATRFHGESQMGEKATPEDIVSPHRATGSVTRSDELTWMRSLIDKLPANYAQVIQMRMDDGASFDEIASRLGESANTVRRRFYRARAVLAELVEMRRDEP